MSLYTNSKKYAYSLGSDHTPLTTYRFTLFWSMIWFPDFQILIRLLDPDTDPTLAYSADPDLVKLVCSTNSKSCRYNYSWTWTKETYPSIIYHFTWLTNMHLKPSIRLLVETILVKELALKQKKLVRTELHPQPHLNANMVLFQAL